MSPRDPFTLSRTRPQVQAIEEWTANQERTRDAYRAQTARQGRRCVTASCGKPVRGTGSLCTSCRYQKRKDNPR